MTEVVHAILVTFDWVILGYFGIVMLLGVAFAIAAMRAIGQSEGVSVKAYAGTSGDNRPRRWLAGALTFPGVEHPPGVFPASDIASIQKFRWSDYGVFPDSTSTYTVPPRLRANLTDGTLEAVDRLQFAVSRCAPDLARFRSPEGPLTRHDGSHGRRSQRRSRRVRRRARGG